jgi:hypothetical protein
MPKELKTRHKIKEVLAKHNNDMSVALIIRNVEPHH